MVWLGSICLTHPAVGVVDPRNQFSKFWWVNPFFIFTLSHDPFQPFEVTHLGGNPEPEHGGLSSRAKEETVHCNAPMRHWCNATYCSRCAKLQMTVLFNGWGESWWPNKFFGFKLARVRGACSFGSHLWRGYVQGNMSKSVYESLQ